jgi:hypothetical protein
VKKAALVVTPTDWEQSFVLTSVRSLKHSI